jgi:hypothetical protein
MIDRTVECKRCGAVSTVRVPVDMLPELRALFERAMRSGTLCDACQAEKDKAEATERASALLEIALRETGIPPEMCAWDRERATSQQIALSREVFRLGVQEWRSLWVAGPQRLGKTRSVCRSAAVAIERGRLARGDVCYWRGPELKKHIARLARVDDMHSEDAWFAKVRHTRLLIIDDIDKGNWTSATLEGLWRLLDDRVANLRVRIWVTANEGKNGLSARLMGRDETLYETVVSITARLAEMCTPVNVSGGADAEN